MSGSTEGKLWMRMKWKPTLVLILSEVILTEVIADRRVWQLKKMKQMRSMAIQIKYADFTPEHFYSDFLGKQYRAAQVLQPLHPYTRLERTCGSKLWTGPALDIVAIWEVSEWMEDLSLSHCLCFLPSLFDTFK